MAKASDNQFPSLLLVEGAAPADPASGDQRLFIDSADHQLKRVNSSGTVTAIEGGGGGGGSASGEFDWSYHPWRNQVNFAARETRTAGTYVYTTFASGIDGFLYNSSHTINDTIDFSLWVGPGTYDLYILGGADTNRGIETWQIDDGAGSFTTLGTLDWYVASGGSNSILKTLTGLTVTGSVVRRKLRCKVASKNASSSDYFMSLEQIDLIRTA